MKKAALLAAVAACALAPNIAHASAVGPESLVQRMLPRAERVGSVESAEVIGTTLGASQVELDSQWVTSSGDDRAETPVDVVVMHGHYIDTLAKVPRGDMPPSGAEMAFTVNQGTGELIEVYVGNIAPKAGAVSFRRGVPPVAATEAVHTRVAHGRRHPTARVATWGTKCSAGSNHHCYALAVWEMGRSEHIYGSETLQYTSQMSVPNWEAGDFVTNEEWLSFFNSPVGTPYWTEMGQEGGNFHDCCSLYAFYAYQNHSGYHEVGLGEQPKSTADYYTMRAAGGGTWCFYVGPSSEYKAGCVGGFESVSREAQDGAEMADESQPTNAAYAETNWISEGGAAYQWDFATDGLFNETGKVGYNGTCVSKYSPWNFPGNIYVGSYGNCP